MWRIKNEGSNKHKLMMFYLLIMLSILLALGVFLLSLAFGKQVEELSPSDRLIILSFLGALVIGGGLTYIFISNKQAEKITELMKNAMFDEVTGVCSRSYFEQRLAESVNRAQRFKKPLAVVLMKVIIPGQLNEAGYPVILRELAVRLTKSTRIYDVNARYEDEVFASIIHEVEEKDADIVVSRIKTAFENKEVSVSATEVEKEKGLLERLPIFGKTKSSSFQCSVQVAIGAVVYREGKYSVKEILVKAETALAGAESSSDRIKKGLI